MQQNLVSIIIPCYNSAHYILETIKSIVDQKNISIEIILVDDGSTDDLKSKILSLDEPCIQYHYQANKGVSVARNHGYSFANGEYIVFFDADDLMTDGFLSSRINTFIKEKNIDFVCAEVQKFNDNGLIDGVFNGASSNAINEILLYDNTIITCPSNYMFKKVFLDKNNLSFNQKLSSTADRYFIVKCSMVGNGFLLKKTGKLLYRVSENSMSHQLTHRLVFDNQVYYEELIKHQLIPENIRNKSLFLGNFILFASYWKIGEKRKASMFAFCSFIKSPFRFVKKCIS